MNAGDYDDLFQWRRTSKTKEAQLGEALEDTSNGGELWGTVEKMTGRRMAQLGMAGNISQVIIRIRNYPEIQFNDVLIDKRFGVTYVIDTVAIGDDELVIEAHALEG